MFGERGEHPEVADVARVEDVVRPLGGDATTEG
jgi:hypothetical protein